MATLPPHLSLPEWTPASLVSARREALNLLQRLLDGRISPKGPYYDAEVLDLSSNENPLGAGEIARQHTVQELGELHRYPLVSSPRLRYRLAEDLGVEPHEIVVASGATSVIGLLAQMVLDPGAKAVYSRSSLFAYYFAVKAAQAIPIEVPLAADLGHDLKALATAAQDARLVLISNPHNPTGAAFEHAAFVRFLESVPRNVIVVLDEAYIDFAEAPAQLPRSVELLREYPNLLALRTFSKVHGLANARVGYAVGAADAVEAMQAFFLEVCPGGIGGLSEAAALGALADTAHVQRSVRQVMEQRLCAYEALNELGIEYVRSHTNFVMAKTGPRTPQLTSFLRDHKVLITSGEYFGYPEWIRFSLQLGHQMQYFYRLLREFRDA